MWSDDQPVGLTKAPEERDTTDFIDGNYATRVCIPRHGMAINVNFADSSVRKVGLKELWTLKWNKGFDATGNHYIAGRWTWPDWMNESR